MLRLAINGYGRVGRSVLRALCESPLRSDLSVVAINELADARTVLHLTRYDTTHGRFPFELDGDDNRLWVNGEPITLLRHEEIPALPWGDLGVVCLVYRDSSGVLQAAADRSRGRGVARVIEAP